MNQYAPASLSTPARLPRASLPTVHFPHTGEIVEGQSLEEIAERLHEAIALWVRRRDGHARRKPRLKAARFNVWRAFEGFELSAEVRAILFEVDSLLSDATLVSKSRVRANHGADAQPAAHRRPVPVDARGHLLFGF